MDDHVTPVNGVAFSPDGRTPATASTDRSAKLWDVTDLRNPVELASLEGHLTVELTAHRVRNLDPAALGELTTELATALDREP
ncbi:hypothetical protein [Saccharothrix deserti]|uniref:hypothetical protein n=1 Tax=Saccharothrix deserti TaxID=2593674 RepID=UPI00131BD19D|nr:hypothetical protein [Saccharothrix deserti]